MSARKKESRPRGGAVAKIGLAARVARTEAAASVAATVKRPPAPAAATAIGFRVKTGWAAVVLLGGAADTPTVLDSRRIELCDPDVPDSRQPHHAGFGTFQEDDAEVKRLVHGVRRYASRAIEELLSEYAAAGRSPRGGAVVAGSNIDPARIANLHMRAHALEGRLYRNLVEEALAGAGLPCTILLERSLHADAAERLGLTEKELRSVISELGKRRAGPWRAEAKAAAIAAWTVLAGRPRR